MSIRLSTWKVGKGRNLVLIVAGVIIGSIYPLYFFPKSRNAEYRRIQERNRKGVDKESIQPGGFKSWTDPFASLKKDK
ncbi:small integral membrane protein 20-like [Panonychus citri]|uniref:small integral membrane protein 20-like n=1 Tax=Panonychus citri TaxID=50023 RepID=UPI002306E64C|nr:small integral membrane protein 20-like [Panonychus citri]XP_053211182.1 small integral membrane protein 20-like [Panonychus citri]